MRRDQSMHSAVHGLVEQQSYSGRTGLSGEIVLINSAVYLALFQVIASLLFQNIEIFLDLYIIKGPLRKFYRLM